MPKITLYVSEEDMDLVKRAQVLLKKERRSLSSHVMLHLDQWVELNWHALIAELRRQTEDAQIEIEEEEERKRTLIMDEGLSS